MPRRHGITLDGADLSLLEDGSEGAHRSPGATASARVRSLRSQPDVELIGDAGHSLPLERPREYVRAWLAWGRR